MDNLEIYPPNDSGSTYCTVRWLAETPKGWVGAWDKEALEYLISSKHFSDVRIKWLETRVEELEAKLAARGQGDF